MAETIKTYTVKEVQEILGVSYGTALKYIKSGKLKAATIGGKYRISEENLQKFINGDT